MVLLKVKLKLWLLGFAFCEILLFGFSSSLQCFRFGGGVLCPSTFLAGFFIMCLSVFLAVTRAIFFNYMF